MRASSVDQILLETLANEQSHLTSQQLHEQAHLRLPAVNPSTIYRALDRLVKQGKVSVSDLGTGSDVFEAVGEENHHHLVCQNCKKVSILRDDEVAAFFSTVGFVHQFQITTNHLILFGLCSDCTDRL